MSNNSKAKVGVGFATGRKNFINVLKSHYKNWKNSGVFDQNISLNIFIAYDVSYSDITEEDFKRIPKYIYDSVENIFFIGKKEVQEICNDIKKEKSLKLRELKEIFGDHGYGKLRNSVLYTAIKNNIDYLLFMDDDEYPIATVQHTDGTLGWIEQNILKTHLDHIQECDITMGYHCGYISPIPYFDIKDSLDKEAFKLFIEAISNEVLDWEKMKKVLFKNKGITYAEDKILKKQKPHEIESVNGGKWVLGSNVCLNLSRMKKIYPFYNPPKARGEDTFFSTCLKKETIYRVPVYSFHDGFLKHSSIMNGIYPEKLEEVNYSEKVIKDRFLKACIGWMRYKPLLIRITNKRNYAKEINSIIEKLEKSIPFLCETLGTDEFKQLTKELKYYDKHVAKHHEQFQKVNEIWRKINSKKKIDKSNNGIIEEENLVIMNMESNPISSTTE
ncbi:MAG: hypothetical protein FWC79_00090 [Oscillospiraceae bacterium]|nr:hypothetical protein [Oscillospiraceae bacterium]